MNDPKRWLDDEGGATLEERALLEAGRQASMPKDLRQRVWLGVSAGAAGLGAGSEAAGATGAGSASSAGGALGTAPAKGLLATLVASTAGKGVVAIAVVASAGLGVVRFHRRSVNATVAGVPSPPAKGTAESGRRREQAWSQSSGGSELDRDQPRLGDRGEGPVIAQSEGPVDAPPRSSAPAARHASRATASIAAPTEPSAAAVREVTAESRQAPRESRAGSRLREESAVVVAIRQALLDGDPALALRMLDRARSDFPGGVLTEEREALAVRALVAAGRSVEARQRGEAFVRAFPRSPHASEVRALVGL